MGRPINKRNFGLLADGTNITINCQVAANAESALGYIIRQRSVNKFLVNDTINGTKQTAAGAGTGNVGVCTLVDKADGALGANEMSIMGYITGGSQVRIKKFYKFCKKYDLYGDGIEEQIVLYLKNIFPKSYKKSQEHLINEDELPSPYDIYGFTSEDKKTEEDFFKVVEKWFKENKY